MKNSNKNRQAKRIPDISSDRLSGRTRIEDVAHAAGVSIMSVSRAMRGVEGISLKKRELILQVARQMGYYPNRVAVSLAASSSNLIGVSVPTLFGTVFAEIYDAMRPSFDRAGYATMIDISDYSEEHEEQWIERMIAWRPAGVILSGIDHSELTQSRLRSANIPVLEIWDFTKQPIDLCVGIDHYKSGILMGHHLVALGYKSPAYIGVEAGKDRRADRRLAGLAHAFMQNGLEISVLDRQSYTTSFEAGARATARLLQDNLTMQGNSTRPDVLCYLNDNMAFGGLMQCESFGLSCPRDIGLVGYNGLNINTVLPKRITTTLTSRVEMGKIGADLLIAKILGAQTQSAVEIPVTIEPGQTTMQQTTE